MKGPRGRVPRIGNQEMKKTRNPLDYTDALRSLYELQKFGIKFGLSKTENLLAAFGDPQRESRYVHIGGTNGKGSVAAMVESALLQAGYRVGLYTSPHLVRFTERFRVNGAEMPRETAAALAGELLDAVDPREPPTFFEIVTAMALVHFAREEVDVAVMEVGMGGRLDATNVVHPLVSVITNISLEHQIYLGKRLLDIAREKGGIIKPGVDLVTGVTQEPVIRLYESLCKEKACPVIRMGKDVSYRRTKQGFNYYGRKWTLKNLEPGLAGAFQHRNGAMAAAVLEVLADKGFPVAQEHIRQGFRGVRWPGRMQVMGWSPMIVVDGGHNPRAVKALAAALPREFTYRRLILVLGIMADKDILGVLEGIVPAADFVIYTRPVYPRAASPGVLREAGRALRKPCLIAGGLSEALDKAKEMADAADLILITGSLFTAGEALSILDPETYRPDEL